MGTTTIPSTNGSATLDGSETTLEIASVTVQTELEPSVETSKKARPSRKVAATSAKELVIPPLRIVDIRIVVVGTGPLMVKAWSEKAKEAMRKKQMMEATEGRQAKNPDEEYQAAFYRLPDGRPGLPSVAFKAAVVSAATQLAGVTKVFLRGAFHIPGDLIPIEGEPHMREDMVRVGMGTADIRYRPEWDVWRCVVPVRFNERSISMEQLVQLFEQAGFSVGVGEWRPERDGSHGMFHVESVQEGLTDD